MFILSPKMYEFMKKVVQVGLPAFSTFYITMAGLWNWPSSLQVAGTSAGLATFLGLCLGISQSAHRKLNDLDAGDMIVESDEEGSTFRFELNTAPEELEQKRSLTFHVKHRPLKAAGRK